MGHPQPSALYWAAGIVGRTLARIAWKRKWSGVGNLPAGPFIVVSNHVSNLDPVMLGHFLVNQGIYPRFLAKHSLFKFVPLRSALRSIGAIPVNRSTATSSQALVPAVAALIEGHVVVIYPEGTFTHDPQFWPMRGKTGAVRLAIQAGVPIVPIAQWGPQVVLPPDKWWPKLWPRQVVHLLVGEPIDAAALVAERGELSRDSLRYATDQVMVRLTDMVAQMRAKDTRVL